MLTMTVDDDAHAACVDAWMERATKGLPAERALSAFEVAFAAVWRRAHQTLGDVTLSAILDRVLIITSERYPAFSTLEVDATGLRSIEDLRRGAGSLPADELAAGTRFLLLEFLRVLGTLTGEILTQALHTELAAAPAEPTTPPSFSRESEQQRGPAPSGRVDREDTK
jgi:hypothetical protein